jgi:hypothetical protein
VSCKARAGAGSGLSATRWPRGKRGEPAGPENAPASPSGSGEASSQTTRTRAREAAQGIPLDISTSYVERSNLSIRMASRRFTRLTNSFSKKLEKHAAAISLYVAHYNFCRVHESLTPDMRHQTTPAMALAVCRT